MNSIDRNYDEKRNHFRMRTQIEGLLVHEGRELAIICCDLSAKGMQVEAEEAVAIGARVKVLIPSAHETLPGLDADGEVVRCTSLQDGRHLLGLAIHVMR